jgi:hypothetical protein
MRANAVMRDLLVESIGPPWSVWLILNTYSMPYFRKMICIYLHATWATGLPALKYKMTIAAECGFFTLQHGAE